MLGYLGFTSSQLLAGAKLASGTFPTLEMDHAFNPALILMGAIAIIYTVMGGLKAVIYTDTIQWIILMMGFIFIGLPIAYFQVGGWDSYSRNFAKGILYAKQFGLARFSNWGITILPIWFVGMTLYQRIFASRDVKSARKAWFIAGVI
jgi:solute:Na+ symporter, SSS family